jgi:uncharacterized protein (TIGR00369 family)
MEKKPVNKSAMIVVQQMMQTDANLAGNVHGGVVMKLIDNTAGLVAIRHSGMNSVTASIDRLDFHHPVFVGNLLRIQASINNTGKSSMEIGVRVEAEDHVTGIIRHTVSAYLTFVALDEDGKPALVPEAIYESDDEKRRHEEALTRKEIRKKYLAELKTRWI